MAEKSEYKGICITCRFADTCVNLAKAAEPVWRCEEFEVEPYKPVTKYYGEKCDENNCDVYIGLCADCENRNSCMYEKPEGGIWHCEEYL